MKGVGRKLGRGSNRWVDPTKRGSCVRSTFLFPAFSLINTRSLNTNTLAPLALSPSRFLFRCSFCRNMTGYLSFFCLMLSALGVSTSNPLSHLYSLPAGRVGDIHASKAGDDGRVALATQCPTTCTRSLKSCKYWACLAEALSLPAQHWRPKRTKKSPGEESPLR